MTDKKGISFKISRLDRIVEQIVAPDRSVSVTNTGKKASSAGELSTSATAVTASMAATVNKPKVPMPGSDEVKAYSSR